MRKVLGIFIAVLFINSTASAMVWEDTQTWSTEWEKEYASWMESGAVHKNLFVGKDSKYYGITADCADASYALRAIFSLENSLPFKVLNPSGSRGDKFKYLSNKTTHFDGRGATAEARLVAMINYLGDSVGTEHLSHHDTIPVKIEAISAGMLFTYKIKRGFRRTIRHSYNIKGVTRFGDFDVIYSTQAIAKKNLPMMHREGYSFSVLPHDVWGFKRFKWPQHEGMRNQNLPAETEYGQEQFRLVQELGQKFFSYVKNKLKVGSETPGALLKRKLGLLCIESRDRIDFVNQGYEHHVETGKKCMNYADYDAYSTPARDGSLKSSFERFEDDYNEIVNEGIENEIDFNIFEIAKAIVNGVDSGTNTEEELYKVCSINYMEGSKMHLAELYHRMKKGLLSSHPNDLKPQRWGDTKRNRTKCKVWY
jgi:hypothetical protein